MKIMVVMGEYPPEESERRRQAVLNCASPGTDIGFDVIKATFFRRSNSQVNSLSAGPLVAEVAVKAEADGYDAVVPFGTLDAGVELARNLVRIPIIGAGQSVLHLGAQLSNRLGVIAYEEKSIPFMRKQMHAWRVADSVVGIRSVEIPLAGKHQEPRCDARTFHSSRPRADRQPRRRDYRAHGRNDGAGAIFTAGI